ncbi:MAG: OmpA family protein [Saprospiraceae bacterium]
MRNLILLSFCVLLTTALAAQVTIEGYVFEENNRGYLNLVKVTVLDAQTNAIKAETVSNLEGFFTLELPANQEYVVRAEKDVFKTQTVTVSTQGKAAGDKVYTKIKMPRKPGYLFEVTLAELLEDETVDAIVDARIEVYNNTKEEQELDLRDHPQPTFSHTLERGNHYTLMIRKDGFFTKRIEAYIDIKGCILCFDGVSEVGPGVSDNLTSGLEMGTLLANIDLERAELNKVLKFENIYYDYNKANIRPDAAKELDNLITILKDNPSIIVELGSHTDSRGSSAYNRNLSQKRAQSAVQYIIEEGGIAESRITAKGYGESQLTNKCDDGVKCSDAQHQKNRRTELKIVGFSDTDPYKDRSLKQIIEGGKSFEELLEEIQNQEIIEIPAGGELPPDLQRQLEQQNATDTKVNDVYESSETTVITTTTNVSSPPKVENNRKVVKSTPVESTANAKEEVTIIKEQAVESVLRDPFGSSSTPMDIGETKIEVNSVSANTKSIPAGYTGYKVQFQYATQELPANHKIFTQHGNIFMDKINNGGVSYMLGDFNKRDTASKFLNNVILMRYPDAQVVYYEDGRRIE